MDPLISAIINSLLSFLTGAIALVILIIIFLLIIPEKLEHWYSIICKILNKLGILVNNTSKEFVKHDIQSQLNDFIKTKIRKIPGFYTDCVKIEWKNAKITKQTVLDENKVIIRLRQEEDNNDNFVRAAYLFVATSLLYKAKRYLSKSQAEATDLYVTMRLIQDEKPEIVDSFLENYLHSKVSEPKTKVNQYMDKFNLIEQGGYFYPVYLQELHYLGQKVFGDLKSENINIEVDDLIEYLAKLTKRVVGDDASQLEFIKAYCRFGLLIVGKSHKINQSIEPYIKYITGHIIPSSMETLYIVGVIENKHKIRQISVSISKYFDVVYESEGKRTLRFTTETKVIDQYIMVLRSKNKEIFIGSKTI